MLFLTASIVWAQEPPSELPDLGSATEVPFGASAGEASDEISPSLPEVVPVPPALPMDLAAGRTWTPIGPDGLDRVSDATIHLQRADILAAAALDGSVWVSVDAGAGWRKVLAGLALSSRDEEVMLQIQARVQELVSQVDSPSESAYEDNGYLDEEALEQAVQDAAEQARQLAAQAVSEVQSELDAGAWFLEQEAVIGGERDRARPRVGFTQLGLLLSARADGLRVSEDLGASWELVLEQAVTAFAELEDGTYAVGLTDGLLLSSDLRRWQRVDALEGRRVTDLTLDGPLWVSTVDGLFWTTDRLDWELSSAWPGEVYAARPTGEGTALAIGTEDTVWRLAEPAVGPATPSTGGPVPRATSLARTPSKTLLAASAAGPWQSADGGRTWTSLALGVDELDESWDIEVRDGLVLLAAASGLYRLDPVPEVVKPPQVQLVDWIPLGVLLDLSLGRRELNAHTGRRWVAAMLPELTLQGQWNQDVGDDWDVDTWTLHNVDTWWQVKGTMTWRPGRQRRSNSFDAGSFGSDLSVLVVGGDVVVDDGTTTAVLGSAVRRGSILYRTELTEQISEMWTTRQRLVAEERDTQGAELVDLVRRRLRVLELEARLDALTNGAVSSWDPTPGGSR
ncbi:MAG: hypothetical protein H6738_07110 [Alphaproteobacteria bacterium]|nr:hypothetical protein [Alphaproteobacteria bacterium]MCB9696531.1 hypothetical protein [Alphaproteobacteria bacterium]